MRTSERRFPAAHHSEERILVIKLRAIGDVLLSTPVLENLRRAYPDAVIDVLTERFAADVVRLNPFINSVIAFDRKADTSQSLIGRVMNGRYTIVFDLFCNPRTALLTYMSGARIRAGFPFRFRSYAYNVKVAPRSSEVHNVDFNLDALRALSIPVVTRTPMFPLDPTAVAFADALFSAQVNTAEGGGPAIGINAGGGWIAKKWPVSHFAALADRLADEMNARIVIFWGPGEEKDARDLQRLMKRGSYVLPKTSLQESAACIRRCAWFISNDSGPMHIASALGVPVLGIYGPTNPFVQGPFGKNSRWVRNEALTCLACNHTVCPIGTPCMNTLESGAVYEAFTRLAAEVPVQ